MSIPEWGPRSPPGTPHHGGDEGGELDIQNHGELGFFENPPEFLGFYLLVNKSVVLSSYKVAHYTSK